MLYEVNNMPQWPHGQSLFFKAVKHCTDRLTLPSNLYLEINFIENNEIGGGCIGPDRDEDSIFNDHGLLIELEINNGQSWTQCLLTLFHEMKHVEQLANGDLDEGVYKAIDTREYEYGCKPQEQEAWEFEKNTMISFLEEHGTIGTN